jgi:excinuclease ABC subunit B
MGATNQRLYVSATPAKFEIQNSIAGNQDYIPHQRKKIGEEELAPERLPRISGSKQPVDSFDAHTEGKDLIVELIIRPTGLLDPVLTLRPLKEQIDETIELCRQRIEKGERVLVTTLTKRTAEDLTDYLRNVGLKVRYIHADVDAIERVEILRSLRAAEIDILVGINLLREGLDLPEVSLVCILDADKEGFLRSETSLIQTVGRAARHINGEAVLFADKITDSIQSLINITEYRRRVQQEHNEKHGITPQSVKRGIQETLKLYSEGEDVEKSLVADSGEDIDTLAVISELEEEMQEAASKLEFERAALIRDQINKLKKNSGDRPLPVKKKR